jgi:hypothetical protein
VGGGDFGGWDVAIVNIPPTRRKSTLLAKVPCSASLSAQDRYRSYSSPPSQTKDVPPQPTPISTHTNQPHPTQPPKRAMSKGQCPGHVKGFSVKGSMARGSWDVHLNPKLFPSRHHPPCHTPLEFGGLSLSVGVWVHCKPTLCEIIPPRDPSPRGIQGNSPACARDDLSPAHRRKGTDFLQPCYVRARPPKRWRNVLYPPQHIFLTLLIRLPRQFVPRRRRRRRVPTMVLRCKRKQILWPRIRINGLCTRNWRRRRRRNKRLLRRLINSVTPPPPPHFPTSPLPCLPPLGIPRCYPPKLPVLYNRVREFEGVFAVVGGCVGLHMGSGLTGR